MTRTAALAIVLALAAGLGLGDISESAPPGSVAMPALRIGQWLAFGLVAVTLFRRRPPRTIVTVALAWLAALALSAVLAPTNQSAALLTLRRPIAGVLLAATVYLITDRRATWLLVSSALAAGGVLVAVAGLLQWLDVQPVRDVFNSLHDAAPPIADVPRLTATLSHPNVAAIVLELSLPVLVALALAAPRPWHLPLGALVLAQVAALVLTFSRAGIAAAAVGLALLAFLAWRRRAWRTMSSVAALAAAGPLAVILAAGALPQVAHRLFAEVEQSSYRATYAAPPVVAAAPEQLIDVPVRVTNVGSSEWTALDDSRVALGYHLLRSDGTPLAFDSPATLLPADVPPNASLEIVAHLRAPSAVGSYVVQWDALREGVAWFSWRGSPPAASDLVVSPQAAAGAAAPTPQAVAMPHAARIQYWTAALSMLRDAPLLGQGPDNFRLRFSDYAGIDESHIGTHAHSLYLESLADTGVVGFVAFVLLVAALLRLALRDLLTSPDWLPRGALMASLVIWLVHGLLDDFERFLPAHLAYWILVGLLVRGSHAAHRAHELQQRLGRVTFTHEAVHARPDGVGAVFRSTAQRDQPHFRHDIPQPADQTVGAQAGQLPID